MTSSALAIVSTCLYLLIIRSGLEPEDSFNPIDGWARRTFCNPFVDFITKAQCIKTRMDKIESTIFSFVLSLADMQLVTGIAMLSAAVIKLHDEKKQNQHLSLQHGDEFGLVQQYSAFVDYAGYPDQGHREHEEATPSRMARTGSFIAS